ncbi:MAG TPA: tRNA (guanosine(37)-N1)-methyltransferase TrmD [Clostridiales bacterium]|nr:tRNA (guanosine(37)-N1)-methyltransferase TrmD [Clostridiales bacterium]
MRFSILTLFPDQVRNFLSESIIGRALKQGIISLDCVNIRDFADNDYGKIDDTLYGGMRGLLIQCEPVYRAWESVGKPYTLYVSPKGSVLDQKKVMELSKKDHICILCGHYEGVDDRVISEICDEEISIGDYVLTGGEIAAVTIVDSVSRMIEGVLPAEDAYTNESHMNGTLEAPQYTKPRVWHGKEVPEVLISGHTANIEEYYRIASLVETWQKRPDMLDKLHITPEDWEKMLAFKRSL